jgi:hypothetical protein
MKKKSKKWFKILIIILVIIIIVLVACYFILFRKTTSSLNSSPGKPIENPLEKIIQQNTDSAGKVNTEAVIQQGVIEFNSEYISYILVALGVGNLHASILGDNPRVEFLMENEIWSAEISNNQISIIKQAIANPDITISMSKPEAVKAILSSNVKEFMKTSVMNGNTKIEMKANKASLLSKGYMDMYNKLKA